MLIDSRLEFADDASLSTAGTSAVAVGAQVDLLEPNQVVYGVTPTYDRPGNSEHAYLCVRIGSVAPDSATGTSTVQLKLVSADNEALSTNPIVHIDFGAIAHETLVAGYKFPVTKLPKGNYRKYLGIVQVASAQLTQGKFDAWISPNPPDWAPFTDGVSN